MIVGKIMNLFDFKRSSDFLFSEMRSQQPYYQPTEFWRDASEKIVEDLNKQGVESFRQQALPLSFFVPTYGYPALGLTKETLNKINDLSDLRTKEKQTIDALVNGYRLAEADYRVFLASDNQENSPLNNFCESDVGQPIEHFEFESKLFSRSALNYLLGLRFLERFVSLDQINNVMEIGGGFGTLGEIFRKTNPRARYFDFDIAPTANVAHFYLSSIFGDEAVQSFLDTKAETELDIEASKPINVLGAWEVEKLTGQIDLFVNFISFQEMEPDVVENYLKHVDRLQAKWILLRNLREGKQIKTDGNYGVEKPMYTDSYVSMLPNYELIEKNVLPFGFKTVDGFHSELLLFKKK